MKLETYIEHLQKIAKRYPDLDVIYASDEEGNNFDMVEFAPSIGKFDPEASSDMPFDPNDKNPNAVCIN